jgi:GT2 family glycosyltransferase
MTSTTACTEATPPSVTIVVVPRERFGHSERSLASIFANTAYPFDLVYVDGNAPPAVAAFLRDAAARRGFRLIRVDHFLSPNAARNLGAAGVESDFVLFIDNDCEPAPGWLEELVRCATETGAAAVAPLYFEGTPGDDVIHMACGIARIVEADGARDFRSEHMHAKRRARELDLRRSETELFEFHCVLVRTASLRELGGLDEALLSNHEHEDLALQLRERGGRILFEPASRVTYAFGVLDRHDAKYVRLRWSDDWNRRSVQHFARKWRLREGWGEKSVNWCNDHREMLLGHAASPARRLRAALGRTMRALLARP